MLLIHTFDYDSIHVDKPKINACLSYNKGGLNNENTNSKRRTKRKNKKKVILDE